MKSIFFSVLLAVLGLLPAVSVRGQQTDLPWISPGSDAAGKQGYYDNSGRCIIPCLFDYASPFRDGEQITTVRYAGKYYLIDRAGNMILLEGFDFMPDVYRRFATVLRKLDTGYEYALIDLYGQRISPEGVSAAAARGPGDGGPRPLQHGETASAWLSRISTSSRSRPFWSRICVRTASVPRRSSTGSGTTIME